MAQAQSKPMAQALQAANFAPIQVTYGKGVQVYSCQPRNETPAWFLLKPETPLYQIVDGQPVEVAQNLAGPIWQWKDGSGVFGKVLESQPSPEPNSIPWLLVQAQPFGTAGGVLARVAYVTRTDTKGGTVLAGGCDAAHIGATAGVPYTATYTFYAQSTR